jgi:hypothetical protein
MLTSTQVGSCGVTLGWRVFCWVHRAGLESRPSPSGWLTPCGKEGERAEGEGCSGGVALVLSEAAADTVREQSGGEQRRLQQFRCETPQCRQVAAVAVPQWVAASFLLAGWL